MTYTQQRLTDVSRTKLWASGLKAEGLCFRYFLLLAGFVFLNNISFAQTDNNLSPSVYIVIAIDTEPRQVKPWLQNQAFNLSDFDSANYDAGITRIMAHEWRNRYRDSYGGHVKFTWFIMSHNAFMGDISDNCSIIYDAMNRYSGEINNYGDEIAWHYHHADWIDANGDGEYSWNQLLTFNGTLYTHGIDREMAESHLNCLLVERGFFPTSFRSGWTWESTKFSNWLEDIIPYDFSASPPNAYSRKKDAALRNQYDWSQAPRSYSGYHPNRKNYQKYGHMTRWIFRTVSPNTEREWKRIMQLAKSEGDIILCLTLHSYDNMNENMEKWLPRILQIADSMRVRVRFATASEAGAAISKNMIQSQPGLKVAKVNDSLVITTSMAIFQKVPYTVLVNSTGKYIRIYPNKSGENRWTHPTPIRPYIIVSAVSSLSGTWSIARCQE